MFICNDYTNCNSAAQVALTVLIMASMVFVLGFFADPILNLYFDPWGTLMPWSSSGRSYYHEPVPEVDSWTEHFAKGFAGMGVLGFVKVLITSPLSYFRIGGGRGRATGRDRYEQVSWIIILIGVGTFLAVCIILYGYVLHLLTLHRPFTKVSAFGVVVRSRELANALWTYKAMKMAMMSSVSPNTR
jgi:hypothetical protein